MVQGRVLDLRRDAGYVYAPEPSLLTWSDQSGWGHHCTAPASANQPTVVATGVDFDGAAAPNGDYLLSTTAIGNAIGTVSNLYVAVVFRLDVANSYGGYVSLAPSTVNANGEIEIVHAASKIYWRTNASAQSVDASFTDTASFHIADLPVVAGVGTPALDGVNKGTLNCGSLAFANLAAIVGVLTTPAACINGKIAKVLISTDSSAENVALARRVLLRDKP